MSLSTSTMAQEVTEIAKYDMQSVGTYDAFKALCEAAELNGLEGYSL